MEIRLSENQTHRYVFKLAGELVAIACTLDREDRDLVRFIRESYEFITDAMNHAVTATHILADHYILPRFGWR